MRVLSAWHSKRLTKNTTAHQWQIPTESRFKIWLTPYETKQIYPPERDACCQYKPPARRVFWTTAMLPILKAEVPKFEAIKNDPSLSGMQKMKQLHAIHGESAPELQKILSPAQHQQLQAIREADVKKAIAAKRAGADRLRAPVRCQIPLASCAGAIQLT